MALSHTLSNSVHNFHLYGYFPTEHTKRILAAFETTTSLNPLENMESQLTNSPPPGTMPEWLHLSGEMVFRVFRVFVGNFSVQVT